MVCISTGSSIFKEQHLGADSSENIQENNKELFFFMSVYRIATMTNTTVNAADSVNPNLSGTERNHQRPHSFSPVRMLGVMVFLLLATPKLRLMIGPAPLYALDILIVSLLLSVKRMPFVDGSTLKPLSTLVSLYLVLTWLGELHGMFIYGKVFESLYMIGEFTLGISLFFIVPRIVQTTESMAVI